MTEELRPPLDMHALLDADFWRGLLFEENLDMQATMMQPVGGMDAIPKALVKALADFGGGFDLSFGAGSVDDQVEHRAARGEVRHQELCELLWRAGRAPLLECAVGEPVEVLHGLRYVDPRGAGGLVYPAPDVERVCPAGHVASGVSGGLVHLGDRLPVAAG